MILFLNLLDTFHSHKFLIQFYNLIGAHSINWCGVIHISSIKHPSYLIILFNITLNIINIYHQSLTTYYDHVVILFYTGTAKMTLASTTPLSFILAL